MRTTIILAFMLSILMISCSKSSDDQPVLLRIENSGSIPLDSAIIINPAGKQVYLNIAANSFSAYKPFQFIYNYAYIKLYYGNQYAVLQPIDYVGETRYTSGRFTYKLLIISNLTTNHVIVENHKD
jgi:hypothetical protein